MLSPARYKQLRWALAQKAIALGVHIPAGYKTESYLPPGLQCRALIRDVQIAADQRGLYDGNVDGTFNTAFQAYLVPPQPPDVNALAARWMLANLGPKENLGSNQGTWLDAVLDSMGEAWMHIGHQPWCAAVGGRAALIHAGIDVKQLWPALNDDYCPSWVDFTRAGSVSPNPDAQDGHHYRFVQVSLARLAYGDHLLFDWPGESPGLSDHFGRFLAFGTQSVTTVEANTQSGTSGDQSDGGGIYQRVRPMSDVLCAGRIIRI